MSSTGNEIQRRQSAALAAIREALMTDDDENDTTLFVKHHLNELDGAYWNQHLQTSSPDPARVIDLLVLRSHWSDEDDDGIDIFDFTLPGDVTDYVISVHFDSDGGIDGISMES